MQDDNLIKSITIHNCPHCKADVYIESLMVPPNINSIFTKTDIDEAKKDCLKRIETLAISDERKNDVIKWINNPEIVFGPAEVEAIILSLLKPEK